MKPRISNVKTNIITGFLGVGKTTAILDLIAQKPDAERWAVLVNEAGQIGLDGELIARTGIYTRQIAGGCMCCAAGLPMQATLTRLLREARPDRLIIEPSGIGHPRKIQKTLEIPEYDGVLDIRATVCLVDPRHLADSRYRESQMFTDQLAVADLLIANKTDLGNAAERQLFDELVQDSGLLPSQVRKTTYGHMQLDWLDQAHHQANNQIKPGAVQEQHYYRESKRFGRETVFDSVRVTAWLGSLYIERVKAILNTEKGLTVFNYVDGAVSLNVLEGETAEDNITYVELISSRPLPSDLWKSLEPIPGH